MTYPVSMDEDEIRREARGLLGRAFQQLMQGEAAKAIDLCSLAIQEQPSAEAYAYRGWARSFLKDFEGAIEDCHQALDLDPEYGDAYNDIGAYRLELHQPEEAIPWFRLALRARHNTGRCFPHYNLGRAYEQIGDMTKALEQYQATLQLAPEYLPARHALDRIQSQHLTRREP